MLKPLLYICLILCLNNAIAQQFREGCVYAGERFQHVMKNVVDKQGNRYVVLKSSRDITIDSAGFPILIEAN
jgi:hypothetical protein